VKLAIFQAEVASLSLQQRLQSLDNIMSENAKKKVDLLLCPELFINGYGNGEHIKCSTQAADGDMFQQLAEISRRYEVAITCGYAEKDKGYLYNSAMCISAQGKLLANHRKRVLPTPYEQSLFDVGTQMTVFELDNDWRVAILICYEAEFPEAVRACALAGAQLVLVPTALGSDWSIVSRKVMPTRAFENGLFLAYANYSGQELNYRYLGDSVILSPMGVDLARADSGPDFVSADIDLKAIKSARKRLHYLEDYIKF